MSAVSFLETVPTFNEFSQLTLDQHYRPVPSDWFVIISDIKGSTDAIDHGRYRDVNRIGAAAIVCASHGMGGREFPYVFGGDGGYALAARQLKSKAGKADRLPYHNYVICNP